MTSMSSLFGRIKRNALRALIFSLACSNVSLASGPADSSGGSRPAAAQTSEIQAASPNETGGNPIELAAFLHESLNGVQKMLVESDEPSRFGFGIKLYSLASGKVIISHVRRNTPAIKSGIWPGDAILKVGEMDVEGRPLDAVLNEIAKAGDRVTLTVRFNRHDTPRQATLVKSDYSPYPKDFRAKFEARYLEALDEVNTFEGTASKGALGEDIRERMVRIEALVDGLRQDATSYADSLYATPN